MTPLILPNQESGPQNQPSANVAISVLAGAARSIGGLMPLGIEPIFAVASMFSLVVYSITDCFNAPALQFKQKLGARIIKSGWHIILFKKWHFGSRSDHP
jgi:hypothetical protein